MFQEPLVGRGNAFAQRDSGLPAEVVDLADVEQLAGNAVRLGSVLDERAVIADNVSDDLGQLADRDVLADSTLMVSAES
jgi:hypothetical protein